MCRPALDLTLWKVWEKGVRSEVSLGTVSALRERDLPFTGVCCAHGKEPQKESRLRMSLPAWKGLNRVGGGENLDLVQLEARSHEQALSG